jgi:hypothetical protein
MEMELQAPLASLKIPWCEGEEGRARSQAFRWG